MKKRILASLLSLCLIVGLLPTAALAADEEDTTISELTGYCGSDNSTEKHTFTDNKGKEYTVYQNLTWTLKKNENQDGYTLSISGNGPMSDNVQWRMDSQYANYANQISVVQIGDGVTSIASGAFREMDALTDIFIPDTVSSIADWSFYDSPIENLVVSQGNTVYVTDSEGVLYTSDMKTLVYYPKARQGAYKLPATVTHIGPSAFMNSELTALDMSEAVNLTTMSHQMLTNTKISDTLYIPENITIFSTYSCAELKDALVKIEAPMITVKAYAFSKTSAVDLSKVTQITHKSVWNSGAYYEGGCQVFVDNSDVLNALTGDKDFNGYPIIFYLNRGIVQNDCSVVKDGYSFGGWYENPDYSDGALTGDPHTGKTYYAKWVREITFNANGGTGTMTAQQVTEGDTSTKLTTNGFTKTGYTFNGWNTQADGTGTSYADQATAPTISTILYAQWTPNTYTIQFNGGTGASGSTASMTATYDQTVTLTANGFTMTGKNFAGWASTQENANAGTVEYSDQTEVLNLAESGTVTLYAVWTNKQVLDPNLTDTVVVYNGQPQKFHVDDTYTVKYYQNREEVTAPTNAGIYDVEISRAEDDTYAAYHGRVVGGLVINKAPLTIKADDQSIRIGSTLPKYTYTVTGLVSGETLRTEPTLTCDADGQTVGTYTIKASGADAGANYTVSYVDGTLTVSKRSSGGGGGFSSGGDYTVSVDTNKHGTVTVSPKRADKGDTVTITVKPDKGYELDELTVTDKSGDTVKLKDKGNGKFTFTMPGSKVTVEASFKQIDAEPEAPVFADVPAGAWYADAVAWAVEQGVTTGTSATTFGPDVSCTRAQMVTFLWRSAGSPEPENTVNPFADVSATAYYYDAVLWAVGEGITNGTSATTFSPDATVNRGQTVTFLWRNAGSPVASGSSFADVAADAYYASAVAWAAHKGITSGTSATTFSPNNACTRAQIVTFLWRELA